MGQAESNLTDLTPQQRFAYLRVSGTTLED